MINDVVAGPTGFVAVGSVGGSTLSSARRAAVWTSPDGLTWTLVPDGPAFRERFHWGHGLPGSGGMLAVTRWGKGYVAVGGAGSDWDRAHAAVWTSPDGSTWTRVADQSALSDSYMVDVTAGPSGLVAVGVTGVDQAWPSAAAWTSSDGRHWRRSTVANSTRSFLSGVVRAGSRFWALGAPSVTQCANCLSGGRLIWTSADGRSWTRLPTQGLQHVDELPPTRIYATGAGGIVAYGALGDRPAGWWSTDGIVFWPATVEPWAQAGGSVAIAAVGPLGDRWIGVGLQTPGDRQNPYGGTPLVLRAWSTDGNEWAPVAIVDPPSGIPDGMGISAAAGRNGVFVVVGTIVGPETPSGPPGNPTAAIIVFPAFPTP